jgi:mRNA-degrading endonuclease RelE of RelBE toxin-antitoxin system
MNEAFDVQTTARFDRELKKLARAHRNLLEAYEAILPALRADPYNRTRQFPIKKLEGVRAGDGQYRIRIHRFRFRYDIEGRAVFLKACSLRREDTYYR